MRTHHSLYDDLYEAEERIDEDRLRDQRKAKLTMTESIVALMIALACVSLIALFLVQQISFVVEERHISDAFVGLILVPLVEKMAGMCYPSICSFPLFFALACA